MTSFPTWFHHGVTLLPLFTTLRQFSPHAKAAWSYSCFKQLSLHICICCAFWDISELLFFHQDISVTCTIVVMKLAVTLFISLYFWPNWYNFIQSFEKIFSLWPKNLVSEQGQYFRHYIKLQLDKSVISSFLYFHGFLGSLKDHEKHYFCAWYEGWELIMESCAFVF